MDQQKRGNGVFTEAPLDKPLIYLCRISGRWNVRVSKMMKIGPVTKEFQKAAVDAGLWCFHRNFEEGRL